MILKTDLLEENVFINPQVNDRWELIRKVIENGCSNDYISANECENIIQALYEREKIMSTGVGNNIAIPHCNVEFLDNVKIFMILSDQGINFDSIDSRPAKIIIILIVPTTKKQEYIRTLASIARVLIDDDFKNRLLSTKTPQEVLTYLRENIEE